MYPAPLPLNGDQTCSMPHCGRLSCFHVRLETAASPDDRARAEHSCGAHLAEVVQELARWAKERRCDAAQVVVYAMTDGGANEASTPAKPFDRLVLGAIPVWPNAPADHGGGT